MIYLPTFRWTEALFYLFLLSQELPYEMECVVMGKFHCKHESTVNNEIC
jgi:hypothetical protein